MDSKYLRLPQDGSDLLHPENEKGANDRRPNAISRKFLILMLSVLFNVILCLSLVLTLREKPTPNDFGEPDGNSVQEAPANSTQPRWTLSRLHGTTSGGIRLTAPKTIPTATSSGKPSYRLTDSWPWIGNGLSRDIGRSRCTYRVIIAKVSTCWKPIINCTVW